MNASSPTSPPWQCPDAPVSSSASGSKPYLPANLHPRRLWALALLTGCALSFGLYRASVHNPHPDGHWNAAVVLLLGLGLTGVIAAQLIAVRRSTARIRHLNLMLSHQAQEHRETKRSLELSEAKLRDSEERYRLLVECSPDIIVTLDMEGRVTACNPRCETVTGWAREEWLDKSFLPLVYPEDFPEAHRFFATALGGGRPPAIEIRVINKTGGPVPMEFAVSPKMDAGRVCGVLAIGRDLSARRKAEQEQAQLQAQLRRSQRMEAIGTLAGGMAHDLNNILTAIISNVELARRSVVAVHPAAERLDEIRLACARAAEMVSQILAFNHQQDPERCCVSLESIVEEVVEKPFSVLNHPRPAS